MYAAAISIIFHRGWATTHTHTHNSYSFDWEYVIAFPSNSHRLSLARSLPQSSPRMHINRQANEFCPLTHYLCVIDSIPFRQKATKKKYLICRNYYYFFFVYVIGENRSNIKTWKAYGGFCHSSRSIHIHGLRGEEGYGSTSTGIFYLGKCYTTYVW